MKALADAASGLQLEEDAVVLTEAEIAANKRAEEKETKKREAAEKKAAKAKAKSGKKSKEVRKVGGEWEVWRVKSW